jgi:hypothetical protein
MRCWTDGVRTVFWDARGLRVYQSGATSRLASAPTLEDAYAEYGPVGALAVSPDARTVWLGAERLGRSFRIDLEGDHAAELPFTIMDATYLRGGELLAVIAREQHGPRELVRFGDGARPTPEPFALPRPRAIRWPFGVPYQFGTYENAWTSGSVVRISHNRFGIGIAQTSGLIVRIAPDGAVQVWQGQPVYQGWIVATPTAEGTIVSALHNGRSGEFVWLDDVGAFYDSFDSEWNAIAPAQPVTGGYVGGAAAEKVGRPVVQLFSDSNTLGERALAPSEVMFGDVFSDGADHACWTGDSSHGVARRGADGRWHCTILGEAPIQAELAPARPSSTKRTRYHVVTLPRLPELPIVRPVDAPADEKAFEASRRFGRPVGLTYREFVTLVSLATDASVDPFTRFFARWSIDPTLEPPALGTPIAKALAICAAAVHGDPRLRWARLSGTIGARGAELVFDCADSNRLIRIVTTELLPSSLTDIWSADEGNATIEIEDAAWIAGEESGRGIELGIARAGAFVHVAEVRSADGTIAITTGVHVEPIGIEATTEDEAIALAGRHLDVNGLFLAKRDRFVLSPFELEGARLLTEPAPVAPEASALIEALEAAEQIALADGAAVPLRELAYAMYGGADAAARAAKVEAFLLDEPSVEDLFCGPEEIAGILGRLTRS